MKYFPRTNLKRAKALSRKRTKRYVLGGGILLILFAAGFLLARGVELLPEQPKQPVGQHRPATVQPKEFSIVASGDVMLGRRVADAMRKQGVHYPFAQVALYLRDADLAFGNLESPLSLQGTPLPGKGIWFRGDPKGAEALREAGYSVMSVANNHTLDYDTPAFLDTLAVLREQGIAPVGGGKDPAEATRPAVKEVHGRKVAFLAATEMADIFWSWKYRRTLEVKADQPGVVKLDELQLVDAVKALKGKADIIIVSLHWGTEFSDYPTEEQRRIAHSLVDAGANLIVGHHPHCLQGVEVYRGSLIAYSLGNFVYDKQTRPKSQEGLLLKVFFNERSISRATLYPVLIKDEQPWIVQGNDASRILQRTAALSKELDTPLVVRDGVGVLNISEARQGV